MAGEMPQPGAECDLWTLLKEKFNCQPWKAAANAHKRRT